MYVCMYYLFIIHILSMYKSSSYLFYLPIINHLISIIYLPIYYLSLLSVSIIFHLSVLSIIVLLPIVPLFIIYYLCMYVSIYIYYLSLYVHLYTYQSPVNLVSHLLQCTVSVWLSALNLDLNVLGSLVSQGIVSEYLKLLIHVTWEILRHTKAIHASGLHSNLNSNTAR